MIKSVLIFLLKLAIIIVFVISFQVFWDVATIIILYMVTMFSFSIGLVSIFGLYHENAVKFSGFEQTFKTLSWIIFDPGILTKNINIIVTVLEDLVICDPSNYFLTYTT